MKVCIYCKKPLDGSQPWQHRRIYVNQLLQDIDFWMHDRCYQARLRWKQEDQL